MANFGRGEAPGAAGPVLTQGQAALERRVALLEAELVVSRRAFQKLVRVCQVVGDAVAVKAVREAGEGVKEATP